MLPIDIYFPGYNMDAGLLRFDRNLPGDIKSLEINYKYCSWEASLFYRIYDTKWFLIVSEATELREFYN